MTTHTGRCHCGAIGFTFDTAAEPAGWSVRACQCSFCRAHSALSTSDPRGSVRFRIERPENLTRYRFGLRTADFLLCRECGVYVGALTSIDGRWFGIVNVNALQPIPAAVREALAMSYDGEDATQRASRRAQRWSPAELVLG